MWYLAESLHRPPAVDTTSSRKHVYLRRNFSEETRQDEAGDNYTVYVYEECVIPKDVYSLVLIQNEQESRIADIEDTIAEIIGGGL